MQIFKMDKYYVTCGSLKRLVLAQSPMMAARTALESSQGDTLNAYYFHIDERGFRTLNAEWRLRTDDVLEEAEYYEDNEDD